MFTNGAFRCKPVIKNPPSTGHVKAGQALLCPCCSLCRPALCPALSAMEPPEGHRGSWGMPVPGFGVCLSSSGREDCPWSLGWSAAHGLGGGCCSAVLPLRFPAVAGMDLLPFAISQTIRTLLNPLWSPKAGLLVDPCFLWSYDLCDHQVAP